MSFITDKQTLDDLNIPGRYRPGSIFSLFNKTVTRGGERLLEEMFQQPLSDHRTINERSKIFQYFTEGSWQLPFLQEHFNIAEEYLNGRGTGNVVGSLTEVYRKKLLAWVVRDEAYSELHHQLVTAIGLLNDFFYFLNNLPNATTGNTFLQQLQKIKHQFGDGSLRWLAKLQDKKKLSATEMGRCDFQLRTVHAADIKRILEIIYHLDVYIAVSGVAKGNGFAYAHVLPNEKNLLLANGLRHPCIEKAVDNNVSLQQEGPLIFLTGANMAGKSTFMKAFGIAVYLAHMGFPVAANEMYISVKDGLYTSINVPDNLSLGYSHFYAEVLRVKMVAQEIARPGNLVIIFDELFKGTNVKDARDATLAITEAFAGKHYCFFIISTHITEAGEELRNRCDNIQFVYFPSTLQGNTPVYTYKLQPGISNDRHGMTIIRKERILELIGS